MVRISVITPTFNRVRFLSKLWQSLLAQTMVEWEWILVDDGSTDGTSAWAHGISDQRLRYYAQPNQGKSVARNYGWGQAFAPYVVFLDSDDWLFPSALEMHCQFLDQHPEVDLCISDGVYVTADGREICKLSDRRRFPTDLSFVEAYVQDGALIGAIHCVGLRSSAIKVRDPFAPNIHVAEDWLFFVELLRRSRIGWIENITCAYVWHSENDTLFDRRRSLLLNTYQELIAKDWFAAFSEETRMIVLQKMVLDLVQFDFEQQQFLLEASAIKNLSHACRAILKRRVALQWLLQGDASKTQAAQGLLRQILSSRFIDKKSIAALALSYLPLPWRRRLIGRWIDRKRQTPCLDPLLQELGLNENLAD